jgi:epoxyqueuosine reductase
LQTNSLEIQNEIISILEKFDKVLYGFAYVGDSTSCKFKNTPYAITIGIPLSQTIVDPIISGPNQAYYDEYLSINDRLDLITEQLGNEIERQGYLAYAISSSKRTDFVNISGDFPHKTAAVRGGLGWIGKSSLLITKKYGPRVRISTILTNVPFQTNGLLEKNYCGNCRKCADACPAGAIIGNSWNEGVPRENLIDVKKCDLWKINNYSRFHGHVCGICVAVCPHGNKKTN